MPNNFLPGDHICALYETRGEQILVAARYIAEGLRSGERGYFVGRTADALEMFVEALDRTGVDARAALAGGALQVHTTAEAHLVDGRFDLERMIGQITGAIDRSIEDGFSSVRMAGDMSWLLDDAPGSSRVVEYEARLNDVFATRPALAMCQYDRAWLPPALIDHALATHRSVVVDGRHKSNPFYKAPNIAMHRQPQARQVDWKLAELHRRP